MKRIILSFTGLCSLAVLAQSGTTPFKMPAEIKFERNIVQKTGGDDKERKMNYYFTTSGDYAAIMPEEKGSAALMIYTKEGYMLIVNEKEKSIIIMNMGKFIGDVAKAGKEMADKKNDRHIQKDSAAVKTSFTKTGKTKTICGYPAEEYEIKNEKGTMTMWYLKTDFDTQLIYTMGMGKSGDLSKMKNADAVGSNGLAIPGLNKNYFMAEMEKNGRKTIETVSISKTDFSFSSAGYTVRDMSDLMKGKLN